MAFERARTALAALEEKLRRQLGLAGDIGAQFSPVLTPVIIATDLREPGNSQTKGRHWAVVGTANYGAGTNYLSIAFAADVIVLGIAFTIPNAGLPNHVYITNPAQASAVATPTAAGLWIDRPRSGDQPPITMGGPGALTGTNFAISNQVASGTAAGERVQLPMSMFLTAGSALNFSMVAAGNGSFAVWGRIAEQT